MKPWTVSAIAPHVIVEDHDEEKWIAVTTAPHARLIAAAPDLLEACKALSVELSETIGLRLVPCEHVDCLLIKKALTAIREAEQEPSAGNSATVSPAGPQTLPTLDPTKGKS